MHVCMQVEEEDANEDEASDQSQDLWVSRAKRREGIQGGGPRRGGKEGGQGGDPRRGSKERGQREGACGGAEPSAYGWRVAVSSVSVFHWAPRKLLYVYAPK